MNLKTVCATSFGILKVRFLMANYKWLWVFLPCSHVSAVSWFGSRSMKIIEIHSHYCFNFSLKIIVVFVKSSHLNLELWEPQLALLSWIFQIVLVRSHIHKRHFHRDRNLDNAVMLLLHGLFGTQFDHRLLPNVNESLNFYWIIRVVVNNIEMSTIC